MDVLILFLFIPAIIAVGWYIEHRKMLKRKERWRAVADDLGGQYVHEVGFFLRDASKLWAKVRGREVVMQAKSVKQGKQRVCQLVVTAPVAASWRLEVIPRMPLIGAARDALLGALKTGHRAFDKAYTLSSSRPHVARVMFGSRSELRFTPLQLRNLDVRVEQGALTMKVFETNGAEGREGDLIHYAALLADAIEQANLLEHAEQMQGGLSVATPADERVGGLSAVNAPVGAVSATHSKEDDPTTSPHASHQEREP